MNDMPQTEIPLETDVVAKVRSIDVRDPTPDARENNVSFVVRDPFRYRGLIVTGLVSAHEISKFNVRADASFIIRRISPSLIEITNNYVE
jgi:hypothetical protein